ncbi:transketolase [Propionibacteriaceae bacterium ES.041]|uniref:1-deoxy-D-xylulose-5-phosphate synthase N-terminal domain-containing protein n=1 Tax=Enemella evansiae TaxID=2016499 RepID=UPI000B961312|nr:1-deoxy-D-xylulose-5-phosphate synthase N-terminal domain-containing protein [Enemella evansiae]OYN96854.1 transketolase [Enemella evansiae]OYO11995.1 transketolase [Enemella evansiae]OYO14007.1 transketolase [Enemella evansiae]PFG69050.1 transketolase [Propionibacteriaceae bacterium ES.041]
MTTDTTAPTLARSAEQLARRIRLRAVQMISPHGFGYLGQALSSAEQLAVLHSGHLRQGIDRFVVSPGHYIIGAYAVARETGRLSDADLADYGNDGALLESIGTETSPAVDLTCGSLSQGLSGALGLALADRLHGSEGDRKTYVLISDGELEEGQTWEAAMFAGHHRLGDVVVLLDANDSQVDGPVSSITTVEPIADKWRAFGWYAEDVDGHSVEQLDTALRRAIDDPRPAVVIARTSTVHGLDCLPADADGHFIKLPADLAARALAELEDDDDA